MAVENGRKFDRGATVLSYPGRDGENYFLVVNDPQSVPPDLYQILGEGSVPVEEIPGLVKLTREEHSNFK